LPLLDVPDVEGGMMFEVQCLSLQQREQPCQQHRCRAHTGVHQAGEWAQ